MKSINSSKVTFWTNCAFPLISFRWINFSRTHNLFRFQNLKFCSLNLKQNNPGIFLKYPEIVVATQKMSKLKLSIKTVWWECNLQKLQFRKIDMRVLIKNQKPLLNRIQNFWEKSVIEILFNNLFSNSFKTSIRPQLISSGIWRDFKMHVRFFQRLAR